MPPLPPAPPFPPMLRPFQIALGFLLGWKLHARRDRST